MSFGGCAAVDRARKFRGLFLAAGMALTSSASAVPALSETKPGPYAVTLMAGRGTDTDFTTIISEPWTTNFVDLSIVSLAASARLGTINELTGSDLGAFGRNFSVETEAGAAYRFNEGSEGEFWGALYFRFDGFPWNDTLYTTAAIDTGLTILTETSEFEQDRSDGKTSLVLHYFSPELTFADPDNKDLQFVLRLHHRSGIFGLIDGVDTGSSFITAGVRLRF